MHAILESATECQHMYIAVNVVHLKRQYHEMSTSCFVKASYIESKTAKSFTAQCADSNFLKNKKEIGQERQNINLNILYFETTWTVHGFRLPFLRQ